MNKNKALFLDRDGVINHDLGYVHKINDFNFTEGIFDLVNTANKQNYLVIVITNQAGIGRGYYSEKDFLYLMNWVKRKFKENNAVIDDIFFCPFHPIHGKGKYKKESNMRKPKPGMILDAAKKHNINLSSSILIGDNISDITAGKSAGVNKNILFNKPKSNEKNDYIHIDHIQEAILYL